MVQESRNMSKIFTVNGDGVDGPTDYNTAITLTGYGTFNVLLLLAAIPIAWTAAFDTTTGAFILATAECDLELNFVRKGLLVSFPYIAMIMTSFAWDFISDHIGKRTLIVLGLFTEAVLNILSTAVSSYYAFLAIKFLNGVMVGGPLSMINTYLTEFHSPAHKVKFTRWSSFIFNIGVIIPAALAFNILVLELDVTIFSLNYNTWRIYLLICSLPSVVALVTACMLPESPKQLIACGRKEDALKLMRRMYNMNTCNKPDNFPVKALLVDQTEQLSSDWVESCVIKAHAGWYNTKQLFSRPNIFPCLNICFMQFGSMAGFNTMRLWVPHLFIILNNFDYEYWLPMGRNPTMCEMLDRRAALPARDYWNCTNFDDTCIDWVVRSSVYINSTIIASSAVFFAFLTGFILTSRFRKTFLLLAAFLISVVSSFGINWAQAPPYMLTLASAIIVTTRIAGNIVTALNVDVIPIPLRQTSMNIANNFGNLGAILGNIVFASLLDTYCILSFMGLGCLFSVCFCLACFIPLPERKQSMELAQIDARK